MTRRSLPQWRRGRVLISGRCRCALTYTLHQRCGCAAAAVGSRVGYRQLAFNRVCLRAAHSASHLLAASLMLRRMLSSGGKLGHAWAIANIYSTVSCEQHGQRRFAGCPGSADAHAGRRRHTGYHFGYPNVQPTASAFTSSAYSVALVGCTIDVPAATPRCKQRWRGS